LIDAGLAGLVEAGLRKGNDALFLLLSKEAGDAKLSAASAEASAKAAGIEAGKAKDAAGTALDKSTKANAGSSKAIIEATNANQRVADLNTQLSAANTQLQASIGEARKLESSLLPRRLFFIGYEDRTSNVDALRSLAGTEFWVESIPDFEARSAAGEIVSLGLARIGAESVLPRKGEKKP